MRPWISFQLKLFAIAIFNFHINVRAETYSVVYPVQCNQRLDMDYAEIRFNITSSLEDQISYSNLNLYAVNHFCYDCSPEIVLSVSQANDSCAHIYSPHAWTLYLTSSSGTDGISRNQDRLYKYQDLTVNNVKEFLSKRAEKGFGHSIRNLVTIDGQEVLYQTNHWFGEKGRYEIIPSLSVSGSSFTIRTIEGPIDSNLPVFILLVIIVAIIMVAFTYPLVVSSIEYTIFRKSSHSAYEPLIQSVDHEIGEGNAPVQAFINPVNTSTSPPIKSERLQSLDTFRGFSLYCMIFVNYGAGGYWYFEHADWNGLTIADLLFPWFMWMMGVSMAMSYAALEKQAKAKGTPRHIYLRELWYKASKRSLIFFGLGLFLANGHDFDRWRIPGVLQYFAMSYFVTSATVISLKTKTDKALEDLNYQIKQSSEFIDNSTVFGRVKNWFRSKKVLWAYRYEWIVQLAILILFLSLCLGAKVPGCPRGYNGAGGLSQQSAHYACTGGIHRYIDRLLFTSKHFYQNPTCKRIYHCLPYDPEGTLGSLTACTLTYIGLMAGRVILHFKRHKDRLQLWILSSFICLLLAGILCGFSQNDGLIPINKNLWSTSFGFVAAGSGLLGLTLTYIMVDIKKWWTGAPFLYLGMNSILIYCFHPIFHKYFPFSYATDPQSHARQLPMDILGASWWLLIAYYFYRIKFFVKV